MSDRIQTYAEFFPYYLREHAHPKCRALHYLGTSLGLIAWSRAIMISDPYYILYGLVAGYACAWIGHFFIEHNKPATFKYPLWSFISDFRMYFLWITGQLGPELDRALSAHRHTV